VPVLQEASLLGKKSVSAYALNVLSEIEKTPVEAAVAQMGMVEPLSERETEVLRLVAAGFSNREIAERLILSLGTVKSHAHNIYGKLHARSRTQAIARARELKLL
jgi:ATP/maltotriose-dependent transcriptional regulator MalT